MDPMQWLEQARNVRAAYLRNPNANPSAMNTFKQQARGYLADQEQLYGMFPGRAAGGSGATGLLPNDAAGYRDMLAGQRAYQGLTNFLQGGSPDMNVVHAGPASVSGISQATGRNNAAAFGNYGGQPLAAGIGGSNIEETMRGLYTASKGKYRGAYGQKVVDENGRQL